MEILLPKKYQPELGFLREVLHDPTDPTSRMVYADWLEEQGDIRAEFLRLELELQNRPKESLEYQELLASRTELLSEIDELWVNLLAKAAIEKCDVLKQEGNRSTEPVQFATRCPRRWENLKPIGKEQKVRYCSACEKRVHYCHDIESARSHSRRGHCVALDASVPRKLHDLDFVPTDFVTMGLIDDVEDPR